MFSPNYQLSSQILENLLQIERLYGKLETLRIPKELELNLERHNLVTSSYISNSIEGNPMTLPEVTNLLLDDRVPVNRDEKEVTNYFQALQSLKTLLKNPLSIKLMNKLHYMILNGVNDKIAGLIRDELVAVGKYINEKNISTFRIKHQPPYYKRKDIEKKLKELFDWANNAQLVSVVVKAGIFHHEYVYIHPYLDGNGRVCRLLTTFIFLKNNYLINKYFVLDDYYDIDRHQYSDKLHSADSGDKTEWLEYFTAGVKYSLQSAFARIKTESDKLNIRQNLTNQEKKVLAMVQNINQITSAYLFRQLKVSRQQAHNLLSSLVKKGFLKKIGSTKSSYYQLK